MEVQVNYLAVIVMAVAVQAVGALWYSPLLFSKAWVADVGISEEKLKEGGAARPMIGALVASLVMAYVLAHFVVYTKSTTVATGLQCGFWTWLGFVATSIGTNYLFERRPLRLFLVNSGYNLVSLLGMGAVLAVWQ